MRRVASSIASVGALALPLLLPLFLAACQDHATPSAAPTATALASGAVARVDSIAVLGDRVAAIARAQHVSLAEARDRAVADTLFAVEARSRKLEVTSAAQIDSVLVRRLAEDFLAEAKAKGPVTDEEIDAISHKRWFDVARPEAFYVVRAIVPVAAEADAATLKRAETVATALRAEALAVAADAKTSPEPPQPMSVRYVPDPVSAELGQRLNAVAHEGVEVKLDQPPPLTTDAFVVLPDGRQLDGGFTEGIGALKNRGDVSPVIHTDKGFHFSFLLARYPAATMPLADRRARFEPEVYDVRAQAIVADLLTRLRKETPVDVPLNVDALLGEVRSPEASVAAESGDPHGPSGPQ